MNAGSEQTINNTLRLMRERLVDISTAREEGGRRVANIVVPPEYSSLTRYASEVLGMNGGTFTNHTSLLVKVGLMEKAEKGNRRRRWLVLTDADEFRYADIP